MPPTASSGTGSPIRYRVVYSHKAAERVSRQPQVSPAQPGNCCQVGYGRVIPSLKCAHLFLYYAQFKGDKHDGFILTPPIGVVLFVVCSITGARMRELVKNLWPFIALMYAVLVLCMLVPSFVTALPRALGY